ncbi:Osmotin thaumatin-like protein [Cristinia sonorae]|uniref:Osmotin thaumatin-like protein n=1 Tax=Cristinia sonorae TaxID=1940300 RepID=A0A8K0XR38_9AGAR|nr:Osmotin thaumatin-like protein [Cristinia sonorae]
MFKLTSLIPLALAATASARTFTVYNGCPFTIWPALFTDLHAGSAAPDFTTGWEAAAFTHVTFSVPDNWRAGRIWARRNCNFNDPNPATQCADGGCNGGLVCDRNTGTGVPPASLAEFTLSGDGNRDFYDISFVDGYNLPIRIDNNKGCPAPKCAIDLGPGCPAQFKGPFDSSGFPVGCKSACLVDPNPSNSPACCSGQFSTPQTCPSSGSSSYSYFKGNCPDAYAYAYDESSQSALWTCDSNLRADYTVTFCPAS